MGTLTLKKNNSSGANIANPIDTGFSGAFPNVTYNGATLKSSLGDNESGSGTVTCNCSGKLMATNLVIGSKTLNCANKLMPYSVWASYVSSYINPIGKALTKSTSVKSSCTATIYPNDASYNVTQIHEYVTGSFYNGFYAHAYLTFANQFAIASYPLIEVDITLNENFQYGSSINSTLDGRITAYLGTTVGEKVDRRMTYIAYGNAGVTHLSYLSTGRRVYYINLASEIAQYPTAKYLTLCMSAYADSSSDTSSATSTLNFNINSIRMLANSTKTFYVQFWKKVDGSWERKNTSTFIVPSYVSTFSDLGTSRIFRSEDRYSGTYFMNWSYLMYNGTNIYAAYNAETGAVGTKTLRTWYENGTVITGSYTVSNGGTYYIVL